jgi:signal transduction histidine kinase
MSSHVTHEIRNVLHRLELMSELLSKKDFSTFSEKEIREDVRSDLAKLQQLFAGISTDR